ncbi:MAG: hypothetical protein EVA81_07965 [Proteobacteria bacterium]|nr:MAG: hypothetical protein EVA81_07965 [Pseudomonadota bacterium]
MYKNNIHPEAKNCSVSVQAHCCYEVLVGLVVFQLESGKHPCSDKQIRLVYEMSLDAAHKSFLVYLNIPKQ